MKLKITILILFIGLTTFAQSTFKKGYYITNDGVKKEGYFMTFGDNLPNTITFKENLSSTNFIKLEKKNLSKVDLSVAKFVRKDISFEILDKNMLSLKENNTKDFKLTSKKEVLTVLLEFSKHTLYSYKSDINEYYFLESNGNMKPLKFKKITENNKKIDLKEYRKQLLKDFKLKSPENKGKIGGVKYNKKGFVRYFKMYAIENGISFIEYKSNFNTRDFKDMINISPKVGFSLIEQTNSAYNNVGNYDSTFKGSQISFGFDLEYFFNTKIKNSSIIFSYNYYTKITNENQFNFAQPLDSEINNKMKSSDLQLKFRRYFKINNQQFIYLNLGALTHTSIGETKYDYIATNTNIADLKYNNKQNNVALIFGAGYNLNNIYFEANYMPKIEGKFDSQNSIATLADWGYSRNMFNISISYNIF
jgi:hypothetical protein